MCDEVRHRSAPRPAPQVLYGAPQAQPVPFIHEVLGLWLKPGSWLPLDGKGMEKRWWAGGRERKPRAWSPHLLPPHTRISSSSSSSMKENSLSGCLDRVTRALSGPRKAGLRSSRTPEVQLDRELLSLVV